MPHIIRMSPATYTRIWSHLQNGTAEQVAFALADITDNSAGIVFDVRDTLLMGPADVVAQTDDHVALTDEAQGRVIKAAWDRSLALIEFHLHGDARYSAEFSSLDLQGLDEWVSHVRWRLKGKPYAAIVVAPSDFDALVWQADSEAPKELDVLNVGGHEYRPTGLTMARLRRKHGRRQVS